MLIDQIGKITPDSIVNAMLESEKKLRFVECVLRRKKVDLDNTMK